MMKTRPVLALLVMPVLLVGAATVVFADHSDASCQVRKEGETKHGASGHCTFSQHQGYINIDLRNGDTYELRPTGQSNHYKDQKGIRVVRTLSGANSQEFRWEGGKKIIVTFDRSYHSNSYNDRNYNGSVGQTPPELRYLVNSRYVGGEVDDQMSNHGYRHVRDAVGGDIVTSYWRAGRSGDCVMVRLNQSRHVTYIATTSDSSCR